MYKTGRKRDLIWDSFEPIESEQRKGKRAKCKKCGTTLEGQVKRMKTHMDKCDPDSDKEIDSEAGKHRLKYIFTLNILCYKDMHAVLFLSLM